MKYSKSAIGLLTAQYRSVLKKCMLINLGVFALGAIAANPANAADVVASLDDYTSGITAGTTVIGTVDLSSYATTGQVTSAINSAAGTGLTASAGVLSVNTATVVADSDTNYVTSDLLYDQGYQNATQVGTLITNNAAGATYNNTTSGLVAGTIQAAIDELDSHIDGKSLTVNTGTGVATITDGAVTADVYTKTQSDSIFVNKNASNVFSNSNTFTGAVTATSGLTVSGGTLTATTSSLGTASVASLTSTGNISGTTGNFSSTLTADSLSVTNGANVGGNLGVTGNQTVGGTLTTTGMTNASGGLTTSNLVLSSNSLTGADTGASAITSGSANTVATTATLLTSAENATYTGTKVTGSSAATLKGALDATNTQVNTNTTAITNITNGSTYTAAMESNVKGTINNAAGTGLTASGGVLSVNTATAVADGNTSYVTSDLLYDQGYQTATNVSDAITASTTGTGAVKTYVEGLGYQTATNVSDAITASTTGTGAVKTYVEGLGYQTATNVSDAITASTTGTGAVKTYVEGLGYQTATNVSDAITASTTGTGAVKTYVEGLGYQTAAQVGTLITNNAAGATYDNTTSGLSATTIQAAIDEVDDNVDDAQGEIDAIESALGVLTTAGAYDNTALTSNYYKTPGTGAAATTLSGALNNMATNVENITGGSITSAGAVSNNYTISGIAYGTPTATTSLAQAIGQISNNIGAGITGTTRAASSMSTAAGNSVNANIQALDTAIGGNVTGTYVSSTASVNTNISTLDSTIGNMSGFGSNHYATNTTNVASNLSALDGQVYTNTTKNGTQDTGIGNVASALGVTYTPASGAVSSTDYSSNNYVTDGTSVVAAIGALDTALKTADTNNAKLDADNTFTGQNTFDNANGIVIQDGSAGNSTRLTATANGLTVSRTVEATGFKIAGSSNNVTSIDTTGAAVTDAAANANVMATGATVYSGAENAKYDGTLVKGDTTSTTIKQAMTATTGALNNVLTTAGTEVDSAKVDVQWNGADNTLSGVLGTGTYGGTHVTNGSTVTAAITALDSAIGAAVTGTNGNVLAANSVNQNLDSIDANMGKLSSLTTSDQSSLVAAINEVDANADLANNTIGAGKLGSGTGEIAGTAGDLNGKTIGTTYTVTQAIADLNATNQNQNGSMSTLAGLINGQSVGADGNLSGTATALAGGFTATNLTAAANELLTDITVTTAGNYISTGANVAANLGILDTNLKTTADKVAVIGPEQATAATSGILTGKAITSDASVSGHTTVIEAIDYVAKNAAGLSLDNTFTGNNTFNGTVKIGSANAISGTSTGVLDMNGNTMTNLAGATFVNGTANANLNADASGNLVTDSKFIAQGLDIGTTGKGFDALGNAKTGTLTIGGANAITGTASSLDMNGNALTNVSSITTTGNANIGGNAVVGGTLTAGATTISASGAGATTALNVIATDTSGTGSTTAFTVASNGVSVNGDTTMTGDLTISDGSGHDFTLSSTSVNAKLYGGSAYGTHNVLGINDDTFVDGLLASTNGLGVFKLDTTTGNYDEVFDVDDTGSIKSDMLKTANAANTITLGKDTSTVTTMNGSLKFNAGTESVNAIDDGTTAQTTGGANTMATVATVLKSAENAVFTPSGVAGSNITGTQTINTAIDTLDAKMGDVSTLTVNGYSNTTPPPAAMDIVSAVNKIDSNMNAVLGGIYKSDGSYDATQLVGDGFRTQADLTASLKDYAANVEAATGGTFGIDATTGASTWTGNVLTTTAVDYGYGTSAADIMKAVSQVASNVGDATGLDSIAARTAIAANNGVASTQTVNANINALNATIGGLSGLNTSLGNLTNGGTTTPATVVTALNNIDATLGTIHGLATKLTLAGTYQGNLASGTTVENHLTAIDTAIGNRATYTNANGTNDYAAITASLNVADAISTVDSRIGTAADLATTYNGVSTANTVNANISSMNSVIGDVSQLSTTHYVADTTNLTDAVKVLDHNMERIDDDLKDLHHQHRSGMASLAAMSALVPNARSTGNTSISLGTGAYQGHTAVAFGGFHYLTDNLLLNAGAAWGNTDDVVYRVGVTYSF